ncbi:BrnT family toxin [Rhizobium sp. Leaf371]|uniref:BrnT family toxin n=1 Tax=Rhizobium sp. Leaf371 TaxID=1736355 RepID=UPI001FCDF714|nr:BrnT family toxin [Rhizobium sp. Leaf371]
MDFADAVYFDPESIVIDLDRRRDYGEVRYNLTGYLDGVLCRLCWTPRNGRMRIISMRKINDRERDVYEKGKSKAPDAG